MGYQIVIGNTVLVPGCLVDIIPSQNIPTTKSLTLRRQALVLLLIHQMYVRKCVCVSSITEVACPRFASLFLFFPPLVGIWCQVTARLAGR